MQHLKNVTVCTEVTSHWEKFLLHTPLLPFPGLGYHKDLQTRATFMEVLTKILQQGTEFDTLAETVLADRFERLVELVTMMGDQGELPIAMALANVVPGSQWVSSSSRFRNFTHEVSVNIMLNYLHSRKCNTSP